MPRKLDYILRFLIAALVLFVYAACAVGQVVGVIPTPIAVYNWDPGTNQWLATTTSNTSGAWPNNPQPMSFASFNTSLGQWVPVSLGNVLPPSGVTAGSYTCANITVALTGIVTAASSGTCGGGSTVTLTTTGTSGAATLLSNTLNIPVYQGQITITTTGSSGPATFTSNTLNIPNYTTGAGSGVQYNPTDTYYLFVGPDSIVGDDTHIYGNKFTVSSFSCDTGVAGTYTCTVNTSTSHGLSVGTWVTPEAQMTGWPGVPSPFAAWSTPYDLFQITAVPTSTSLQFTTTWASVSGISGSGGTIEDASYFMPVLTSKEPFFNGHGQIDWALPIGSTVASLNSNYSTVVHPRLVAWQAAHPGSPMYVIFTGPRNDLQACTAVTTIESNILAVAASVHTDGGQFIFNTVTPSLWNNSNLGCHDVYRNMRKLNTWAFGQFKINATTTGQYFDRLIDQYSVQNDLTAPGLTGGGLNGVGRAIYAEVMNEGMSAQGTALRGLPDWITAGPVGGSLTTSGAPVLIVPDDSADFGISIWSQSGLPLLGFASANVQLYTMQNAPCIGQSSFTLASKNCVLSITTTGSSGPATLSGTVLNIPNYSGGTGIANTTVTEASATFTANTCTSARTATMTGVTTASVFDFTPTTDITAVLGFGSTGGLVIAAWPTANTLNYKVCNQTSSGITTGSSVTFNVGAR